MQTRKCHADANADANRIRTKNSMSPSPSVGDKNEVCVGNNMRTLGRTGKLHMYPAFAYPSSYPAYKPGA